MAALICIKNVRGTFCQLVNIANRFLRIFSNLETLIRFIFPGGAGYPYLPTQLIGIQKEPESPVVVVHCQDIKKIPTPLRAVSWLTSKESSIKPSVMILGASTMHRTLPSLLPITMAPSVEESVIADGESISSISSSSDPSDPSQVDVTLAPLISVPTQQVERQASGDRFVRCVTPISCTQNGFGTG